VRAALKSFAQKPVLKAHLSSLNEPLAMNPKIPPNAEMQDQQMRASELTTKAVSELSMERFFIPSYQRGYRWESEQVTALLGDLAEHERRALQGQFYCLQPLVVFKNNKRGDSWDVVDGQQRLTTLFLILRELEGGVAPFHIQYERHPTDLDSLSKEAAVLNSSEASPDLHFIRAAIKVIQDWRGKNCFAGTSLRGGGGACAKFIWHCVDNHEEAMRSFARLNGGKIKLKDAELIRAALLVRREDRSDADRQRIALRWDDMERRLQEPEFWAFLSKEEKIPDCRIEWLLRLTAPEEKTAKAASEHAVFEWFLAEIENRNPSQVWEEVESCFSSLEEWFEDNKLFHLVGFLTQQKPDVRWLLASAKEFRKKDFRLYLKREIRDKVFGNLASGADISSQLEKLTYGDPQTVQKVLLLFNLAALDADQTGTVRFSFHAYQKQDWDIEHIHASASRGPETKQEYKAAFEALENYFARRNCKEKAEQARRTLDALDKHDTEYLSHHYAELSDEFNNGTDISDDELDNLWNLTLLDAKTNRGFGNSPFPVKRDWILGLDPSERYILPCTRNVFTKAYSLQPNYLLRWMEDDASDYLNTITRTLEAFFHDTWSAQMKKTEVLCDALISKTESTLLPSKNGRPEQGESSQAKAARVSFLDLFKDTNHPCVEIPLLQRDYAQGRTSAGRVRMAFLKAIHESLVRSVPLNMDFVYGEADKGRFQPIDGQQRLTTLYLLHWFLASKANQLDDFRERMRDKGEPRFRYSVRQSSQRFFNSLLDISAASDGAEKLSDRIKDQPWFSRTWMHDPTIAGALVMIDAIATEFSQEQAVGGLYSKLTSPKDSPITLDVLDLGSIGQSEEIYIKMNARGKELTGFEKFKAWLIETHKDLLWPDGAKIQDRWQVRLDGCWLDLFWDFHREKKSPSEPVSAVFFRTFVALAVNVRASSGDKFQTEWLDEGKTDDPAKWKDFFTEDCVKKVFEYLDCLSQRDTDQEWPIIIAMRDRILKSGAAPFDGKALLLPFFEEPTDKLTLDLRLWLHATCLAIKARWRAGSSEETHWFRIVRNLLQQSSFNSENYTNAVRALDTLASAAAKAGSILNALNREFAIEVKALNQKQLDEEREKAKRILSTEQGSKWELAIMKVERHAVFHGQIEVLQPQTADLETFLHRCSMVDTLWGGNGSIVGQAGEYLLARAILARCEPIKLDWQDRISLDNTVASWRILLDRQEGWAEFRAAVLVVLDSLSGIEDVDAQLRDSLKTTRVTSRWMLDLIEHGDHLLRDSHGKVQNHRNHGVFVFKNATKMGGGDILIGGWAALRHQLIHRLIRSVGWTFLSGEEWREVSTGTGPVFFRGHQIPIHKILPDGKRATCVLGYDRLTVRILHADGTSQGEISSPANTTSESLQQFLEEQVVQLPNEALKAALNDLAQVFNAHHKENSGLNESQETTTS
jgi:hypothetical protein